MSPLQITIGRIGLCLGIGLLPLLLGAAGPTTLTDNEEHVLRGFFDRQSGAIVLDRLALEKASTEPVKKFAQSELDLYASLADGLAVMDDEFQLIVQPITPGASRSPKLGQGVTRGVYTLPPGATWASAGAHNLLNGGGGPPMPPAAAPAAGGAPSGPGAPAGAPPAGPPGGGAMMMRYDYDLAALKQLSGPEFDHQYLLRVAIAHNAMVRHVASEVNEPGANPDLVAYAKSALTKIAAQNSSIELLLQGLDPAAQRGPGGPPPR